MVGMIFKPQNKSFRPFLTFRNKLTLLPLKTYVPLPPPHRPASRGSPDPHPPRQGGWSPPRPRDEPERDPPPRPSRRLPQGPRRTSEPAPTRQDAAQIAPREGG